MGEARDMTRGKVVVEDIPERVTREKLHGYFGNKTKSGGGDMKSFVYPILDANTNSRSAVIEFEDESAAQAVIAKDHTPLKNVCFRASAYEPVLFGKTKIYVNQSKFDEITERHADIEELISDSGVQKLTEDGVTALEGEWYQIFNVGKTFEQLLGQKENTSLDSNNEVKKMKHDFVVDSDGQPRQQQVSTIAVASSPNGAEIDSEKEGEQTSATDFGTNSSDQHQQEAATAALPNGNETGSGFQTSEIPNTEDTNDSQITLDKDILNYIKLNMRERFDNFVNRHDIHFEDVGDDVCAKFRIEADSGINDFQKFYQETMESVEQKNYTLPLGVEMKKVYSTLRAVREKHPRIQIAFLGKLKVVLFIGASMEVCETAVSDFRSRLEGTRSPPLSSQRTRAVVPYTPSEELFRHTFPDTGLILTIARGDIAAQNADAIVNAANAGLRDGAGVTGAIYSAGGDKFRQLCQDLMYDRGYKDLNIGEVVHTDARGKLQCNYVLHVVGPRWYKLPERNRREECQQIMDELCWSLIEYSNLTVHVSSLATPAIGTGIYGVPLSVFCEAMVTSVQRFQQIIIEGKETVSLREVRLVNYDPREAREIVTHIKKMFGPSESSV